MTSNNTPATATPAADVETETPEVEAPAAAPEVTVASKVALVVTAAKALAALFVVGKVDGTDQVKFAKETTEETVATATAAAQAAMRELHVTKRGEALGDLSMALIENGTKPQILAHVIAALKTLPSVAESRVTKALAPEVGAAWVAFMKEALAGSLVAFNEALAADEYEGPEVSDLEEAFIVKAAAAMTKALEGVKVGATKSPQAKKDNLLSMVRDGVIESGLVVTATKEERTIEATIEATVTDGETTVQVVVGANRYKSLSDAYAKEFQVISGNGWAEFKVPGGATIGSLRRN